MKATEAKLLEFLKKSPQFVIPIYQRTYSWAERECRQLWDDILRTGRNDAVSAHFVGSIVYVEKGLYSGVEPVAAAGDRRPAAADHRDAAARGPGAAAWARASRGWLLRQEAAQLLPAEPAGRRRAALQAAPVADRQGLARSPCSTGMPRPKDHSIRVEANFEFFKERVAEVKDELRRSARGWRSS